jgi:hypothetical protein
MDGAREGFHVQADGLDDQRVLRLHAG